MPTIKEVKHRLKGVKGHVAVSIWCREDVIGAGKENGVQLSDRAADIILDDIDRHQDCEYGITWETIRWAIASWCDAHPRYRRFTNPDGLEEDS